MGTGIEIRDVVVSYGEQVAVAGVSLTLQPGHILGLVGPSGSGKSSLVRAVAGFEPLRSGSISVDGEDLTRRRVHQRGIGMVHQSPQLFPRMSVAKNVGYGLAKWPKAQRRRRVEELLELVGLLDVADRKPDELSGGQAQRAAIARSLAPRPQALMCDEPLSALHSGLRSRLADELHEILRRERTTAIYVTHEQEEAYRIADDVAVMDAGTILQRDSAETLRRAPASRAVAALLGYRTCLTQAQAEQLGWQGHLAPGMLLGLGPHSFEFTPQGIELDVLDQGFAADHVQIGLRLPDGARTVVAHTQRLETPQARVRLVSGVPVPA